jgi:hypothetical protein
VDDAVVGVQPFRYATMPGTGTAARGVTVPAVAAASADPVVAGVAARRHGPQSASGFLGRGWGAVVQVKDATVETVVGAAKVVLLGASDRFCVPSRAAIAPKQPTAKAIAAIAPRREPPAGQANAALLLGNLRRTVLGGLIAE